MGYKRPMGMKILVEVKELAEPTGVARYGQCLAQSLEKLKGEITYSPFRWKEKKRRVYLAFMKRLWVPPIEWVVRKKGDAILFTDFVCLPTLSHTKSFVIVYDLSFIKHPEYVAPGNRKFLERYVPLAIKKADGVITISEAIKIELIETYGVAPEKITVAYPAVDLKIFYPRGKEEIKSVKSKYHLPENYFLFTGTLEPRKNITAILSAYRSLPETIRDKHALVLAGGKGWLDEAIQREIASNNNLITPGYVPDTDLPALYSGATAFVFPSFYEGFGIPPLEAMACGAPVVTSNCSSLPEVVGNDAILIDPKDVRALSEAMKKMASDLNLRNNLSERGLNRARLFSWDRSAEIVDQALRHKLLFSIN
jgi:glycosyltransferase involved in cell wall biosynthesis